MSERWPALLSVADAAEYLSISTRSLKRLQAAERIRPVTIRDGSFLRFRRTDLDRFIDDLPFGSGTCAANEKRIAVMMLAKAAKAKGSKVVKTTGSKSKGASKGNTTKRSGKAAKNDN